MRRPIRFDDLQPRRPTTRRGADKLWYTTLPAQPHPSRENKPGTRHRHRTLRSVHALFRFAVQFAGATNGAHYDPSTRPNGICPQPSGQGYMIIKIGNYQRRVTYMLDSHSPHSKCKNVHKQLSIREAANARPIGIGASTRPPSHEQKQLYQ